MQTARRIAPVLMFAATLATVVFAQAQAYGAMEYVSAGAAEAPEFLLTVPPSSVKQASTVATTAVDTPAPAPVVEEKPAQEQGPNTDPSITAPQTVDPNGAGISFAPEGTQGCYDTVHEYLDEWHTTGVQPQAPCFVVPN